MNTDGLCGDCHRSDTSQGPLGVVPVNQPSRYMSHGWFDHQAHQDSECSDCHKADQSERSSDLLLPDLASCRDCHMGEGDHSADVPSTCAMCHSYHPPAVGGPAAPRRVGERENEQRERRRSTARQGTTR